MEKKIILLEDRPERLGPLIREIQEQYRGAAKVTEILCYGSSEQWGEEKIAQLKEQLGKMCDMREIICQRVDIWNFDQVMDELYDQGNTGFIMDTQLYPGEEREIFDYRINISYALRKQRDEPETNFRIWFYTLAGQYYEKNITSRFRGYVIDAKGNDNGIRLDLENCRSFKKWITEGRLLWRETEKG